MEMPTDLPVMPPPAGSGALSAKGNKIKKLRSAARAFGSKVGAEFDGVSHKDRACSQHAIVVVGHRTTITSVKLPFPKLRDRNG